jgi:dTDP-4-dehydrorhamnose reductase
VKKKILIIGKKSFITSVLKNDLKNFFFIRIIDFENFMKIKKKYLINFNHIINCSLNRGYVTKRYNLKNDFDFTIAKKIKDFDINYIFLSTRKVYKPGNNLKENSIKKPKNFYSKNKLITEKKLLSLLKTKVLILRISNLIGYSKITSFRKIHNTFIDQFFFNVKRGYIIDNKNNYKDFLSSNQFTKIIKMLIEKKIHGIYNVSIGRKVYLCDIVKWLNYYNNKKYTIKKLPKFYSQQNFYLNNSKLLKTLNIKLSLTKLKKDCKRISKLYFKK